MRPEFAVLVIVGLAGCGASRPPPPPTTPVEPAAIGAVPLPPPSDGSGVPAELRDARFFHYADNDVLRADLSSLGDFYLHVGSEGDGEEVVLDLAAKNQAAVVRVNLMHRAYDGGVDYELEPWIDDQRADAVYVQVGLSEYEGTRFQVVVFRIGDELRLASRVASEEPGGWEVFQVLRLAPRAEIHPMHTDPH